MKKHRVDILNFLVEQEGKKVGTYYLAAKRADSVMLSLLFDGADTDECMGYRDPARGNTLLHAVCQSTRLEKDKVETALILLQAAPFAMEKLHVRDQMGQLPLAYASGELRQMLGEYAAADANWFRVSRPFSSHFVSID